MCIVGTSLIYELMVEASVEEVIGSSNVMQVVIVGNVDHDNAVKGGPKVIHVFCIRKKGEKLIIRYGGNWWQRFNQWWMMRKMNLVKTLPMKMLAKVGIVWDFHIFGMPRILCTCCKQGNSPMMCLKRRWVGLKSCPKLCMAHKSIFFWGYVYTQT